MSVSLVEILRAGIVDCVHRGDIVVANSNGQILYKAGNADRLTFFRSSQKPFQAIALLETGIAEKYDLDLKEIALITASHSGEKEHIQVLEGMMKKIGINSDSLKCGIQEPFGKEAAMELVQKGEKATKMHCNCSGKHTGFIAASKILGLPVEDYDQPWSTIQQEVDKIISLFTRVKIEDLKKGVDGCGLPVHAVPLKNIAYSYANLCNPEFMLGKYKKSQNYIFSAMTMYPEMIAGKGRFDTALMKRFGDRLISKMGSGGLQCIGFPGKSVGIAIKIDDGSLKALPSITLEVLRKLKLISDDEVQEMKEYWKPDVKNLNGETVGEIRSEFMLNDPSIK
jgi:L-asparaginase II